jgi:LuxR family transcriptional regulator, maltose regulon positive regulatory protein
VRTPLQGEGLLARSRVFSKLDELAAQHSFLAIVAGPGYGKTSVASDWIRRQPEAHCWVTLAPDEEDPHSLLLYLRAAVLELSSDLDTGRLDSILRQGLASGRWRAAMDAFLSLTLWGEKPIWLVLDDLHCLKDEAHSAIDYLLRFRPSSLRILATTRRTPELPYWSRLVLQGQTGVLSASDLAFGAEDLLGLGLPEQLLQQTAGWPLAIDLARRGHSSLPRESEEALQREFWESLDEQERDLLERSSALDFLSAEQCSQICPDLPVEAILERLRRHGALVQPWSQHHLRLHPLFLEFVRRRLERDQRKLALTYQQSAQLLLSQGQLPLGLSSAFNSDPNLSNPSQLEEMAREFLAQGAYERLSRWVETLEPNAVDAALRNAYAQALGATYRFEQALAQYAQLAQHLEGVERGRSLLAAGRLLVTTLQPQRALASLQKAYRLLPPEERGSVLELLAENSLNQGQARNAQRFRQLAQRQSPHSEDDMFRLRLLLRTGQLEQAQVLASSSSPHGAPQEGHRDRDLVLAYLLALQGQGEPAERLARRALRNARDKGSLLSEAVAQMRLGHALQLQPDVPVEAILDCYREALQLAESTGAIRLKAEAHMGRSLFLAGLGQLADSYQDALDGLELTRSSGDAWLNAWLRLCVAISAIEAKHDDCGDQLELAKRELQQVRDRFGIVLAHLWSAILRPEQLVSAAEMANLGGYRFLLERQTLFGPRKLLGGPKPAIPVITVAEPSSALRICVLGPLRIFRQDQEIPQQAFKRRKARELLGILLVQRGQPISKERLWDLMFPDSDAEKAARDLRVAFHALFDVLDPERPHNHPARWVTRRDDLYSLPWSSELSLDWRDYERFLELGSPSPSSNTDELARHWEQALQLVRGELLSDFSSFDWSLSLREGWRTSYLVTATRLAQHYLEHKQTDKCLSLAHSILEKERCWEAGYRLLMQAHIQDGRPAQATRVYDLCSELLRQELGVEPSDETEELFATALRA